ncbi:uncharacterized protein K02A2.6-like [Toxorhynchites rutilus septentrionalis]|uniref:uncharacterized protein K02A2.6-like n=1 Tax=Toxorhynchites rutilus septentrionalis TaxID=329112 RepID=UPI00247B1BFA|nr:uncharacterized protein K02A2.6-like [Toxorhynchites rutilus septentrionalis]
MYDTVDRELDRLEKFNIITPVDYSEWAAPIVVVRKSNGSIRICGDYSTGLNAALQPQQYPLPLPDDIFAKLAKCKIFSQIDLSDAFLQVEVDEQYRSLLTINTHRGLYLYNRLPPGLKIAPGAFQQLIDTILAGLKDTSGYLDDVIVGGETEKEHDLNLRGVLKRIQDFGFTIRVDKYQAKIEAITKLPPPADVYGVRSFLGAINYYGKIVPNMRMLCYPLDNLLKVETKFSWSPECQKAFDRFKQILSSDLLLTHYNPKREIIVSADASSIGLGTTISHRFPDGTIKVVQHASRALTKAEQGYSQPDREGLAIIFAVTKFHKMLFGRHFRLQTVHRPLLRIFGSKKGIPVYTANRLQRFALNLLLYDFEIEYVSTEKFGNADLLSRLIDQHIKPEEDYVIVSLNLEEDIRVVAQITQADPLLREVHRYVQNGWSQSTLDGSELRRFQSRQESLSVVDGCPHSPPVPWPKSTAPWQRVHVDFAGPIEDDYYLLAIDSFSKWPEIIRTTRITSAATISILRGLFARLGMPITLAERFVDTFKRAVKKIREGRGSIEEALDVFLLTYRSTPSHALPDQKSPFEIMFGRKIRTCLELLRPPPVRVPVPTVDDRKQPRSFN